MATFVILIVIGYLIGSIPSSYLSMRLFTGKDIRTMGTGNATVTAVLMYGGKRPALAAFVAEIVKSAICVLIAYIMVGELCRGLRPGSNQRFGGAHYGSLVYITYGSHQAACAEQSALPYGCSYSIVVMVRFLGICPGRMLTRDAFLHKRVNNRGRCG